MSDILLATSDRRGFSELEEELQQNEGIELMWAANGESVLELISTRSIDLVIVDENLDDMSGLDLAFRMLKANPMINSAVVSNLSDDEFHEEAEGLGILMKLPPKPDGETGRMVLEKLRRINSLNWLSK